MPNLDPRFIIAPNPQEYYVDKDTGAPLAGGIVTFYRDVARTVLKPIYQLTGTPGNYVYTPLPNPNILTTVGTIADGSGNDVKEYYFPYDGIPTDSDGTVDLYFVTIQNSLGVFQESRQAWPNFISGSAAGSNLYNYVSNGQFWPHTNVNSVVGKPGQIIPGTTQIAQGGWQYVLSNASTAITNVTFNRFNPVVSNPTTGPHYSVAIQNLTTSPTDSVNDLRLVIKDVNRFSSTTAQEFTFYFEASTLDGGTYTFPLILGKNFGTGGSPSVTTETTLTNFTVVPGYFQYQFAFTFGNNVGKTLGNNDDDYVYLSLRLPTSSNFNISFTNFVLAFGNVTILVYPPQGEDDVLARATAGTSTIPNPTGSNLLLPITLTNAGSFYDGAFVGALMPSMICNNASIPNGWLFANGQKLITANYDANGIPYSRLFNLFFNTTISYPIHGTGYDYAAMKGMVNAATGVGLLQNNSAGKVNYATDGAAPTGFNFGGATQIIALAAGTNNGLKAYLSQSGTVYVRTQFYGAFTATADGTGGGATGFSFQNLRPTLLGGFGLGITYQETAIAVTGTIAGLSGKWFSIYSNFSPAGSQVGFYVWFNVDSASVDPAPAGLVAIKVNLFTVTDAIGDVTSKIVNALNAVTSTTIKVTAVPPASSYFLFFTALNSPTPINYAVWYTVNGVGTAPVLVNTTLIKVDVLSTDSLATVLSKTVIAINSYSYQVPDTRGLFLRGFDPTAIFDQDNRLNNFYGGAVSDVGTLEFDESWQHAHPPTDTAGNPVAYSIVAGSVANIPAGAGTQIGGAGLPMGGIESRGINMNARFLIKY